MSFIIDRLNEHYNYILNYVNEDNVVALVLVGSQNYGTDLPNSDIDTKLLTVPSLEDVYRNRKGESKTYNFPDSNEQITVKDIRCFLQEIKKQNLNILEILYTDYCIVNPMYKDIWNKLLSERDNIVRYDVKTTVKTTKGIGLNSYDRLFREDKISCKQVANLVRLEYYLKQYIDQKPYIECLRPEGETLDYIMQIRRHEIGNSSLMMIADAAANSIKTIMDAYCLRPDLPTPDPKVEDFLNDICKEFIDKAFFVEYARNGEL